MFQLSWLPTKIKQKQERIQRILIFLHRLVFLVSPITVFFLFLPCDGQAKVYTTTLPYLVFRCVFFIGYSEKDSDSGTLWKRFCKSGYHIQFRYHIHFYFNYLHFVPRPQAMLFKYRRNHTNLHK